MLQYQEECFKVLARAFQPPGSLPKLSDGNISIEHINELEQIREMALGLARLAEEHIQLEERVSGHDVRFARAVAAFQTLRDRLTAVEQEVAPPQFISRGQADQIYNQVKSLANLMTSKDKSKNHYSAIFATIYQMFGVSSYERIRRSQFEQVMTFLDEWRKSVDAGQLAAPRQLEMFDGN